MNTIEKTPPSCKPLLVIAVEIIVSLSPNRRRMPFVAEASRRPGRYRRCGCTGRGDCGRTVEHFVLWKGTSHERAELNVPYFADAEAEMRAWDGCEDNDD
jgi:hypothetical protein